MGVVRSSVFRVSFPAAHGVVRYGRNCRTIVEGYWDRVDFCHRPDVFLSGVSHVGSAPFSDINLTFYTHPHDGRPHLQITKWMYFHHLPVGSINQDADRTVG